MTQNNPAFDVREKLISDGVVTPIFISKEPADPFDCITLHNLSSSAPNPKYLLDNPGLQVRSRATSYYQAYHNAQEVFNYLLGCPSFTQNTTLYTGIWATTGILDIGSDENDRFIVVFTLRLTVEPLKVTQYRTQLL